MTHYYGNNKEGIPQSLHDEMLYFIYRKSRLFSDVLERHCSIVGVPLKNRLNECHQTYLLSQESVVFLQDWL